MKKVIQLIICLSLCGCAMAFGPAFSQLEQPDDKAIIYVYRQAQFYGSGNMLIPRIWLNDEKIGSMRMGGYYPFILEPGEHKIEVKSITGGSLGINTVELKGGEVRYFEYKEVMTGMNNYGGTAVAEGKSMFLEVPPNYALKRLKKTKNLAD